MKYHLQFNLSHGKQRAKWIDLAIRETKAEAEKELEEAVRKELDDYARALYRARLRIKGKRK